MPDSRLLVAVGAAGLLLVLLLFRADPEGDLPMDQAPVALAVVQNLMTKGVLVDYDCSSTTARVNRAVWLRYNADQHRNLLISLATVCQTERSVYRITVVDYDTEQELASFDGKNVRLNP